MNLICTAIIGLAFVCVVQGQENETWYPDPKRFEEVISTFEKQAKKNRLPRKAIICAGSSTMSRWQQSLYDDLAPLTIIPRGFEGSNMKDLLHYADRIFLSYHPRAIILHQGDNDIALGATPDDVIDVFRQLVKRIHTKLPKVRFYVLSIKPSPKRWKLWSRMKIANNLLEKECAQDERLTYIDISSAMIDQDGKLKDELFLEDDFHMSPKGYEIWREIVRTVLIKAEWPHE